MSELFKPYRLAFMSPEGGEAPGGDGATADTVDAGAERPDESAPLTDEQVLARVESAMKLSFQKPEIKIGGEIFKPKSFFPGLMLTYQKGFEAAQTQNPFPELKSPEEFQKAWEAMAQRFLGNLEVGATTDAAADATARGATVAVGEAATVSGAAGTAEAVDAAAVASGSVSDPRVAATVSETAVAPETPENAATPEKAETTLVDTLKEKKADILKVIDAHTEYTPKNHDWVAINAEMMKAINGPEGKGDDKSVMDFVKNMQEMLKVESDGKIGPITMEALKNYLNGVTDSVENAPDKFVKIEFTDAEYGEMTRLFNEGKLGDPFTLEDVKKMSISVDKKMSLKASYNGEDSKKVVETFNAKLTEKEYPPIGMYIQSTDSYKKAYAEASSPVKASTDPAVDAPSGKIQSAPSQGPVMTPAPESATGNDSEPTQSPSPASNGDVVAGQPAQAAQGVDQSKDVTAQAPKDAQVAQGAPAVTDTAPEKADPAKRKAEILGEKGKNWTFTGDSTIGKIDRSKADDLLASKMAEQGYGQNTKVKIEAYNTRPNGYQQLYEVYITIGTYKYIGRTDARVNKDPTIAFAEAVKLIKTSDEEQAEVARKAAAKKAAEEAKKPDGPELAVTSGPAPSPDAQKASPGVDANVDANAAANPDVQTQKPKPAPAETVSAPEAIVQAEWTFEGNIGNQLEQANAKEELGKLLYQKGYRTIKNIVITANEVDENRTETPGKEYIVKIKLDGQEFEGTAFDLTTAFKIAAMTKIPEINTDGSPQPGDAPPVQQATQEAAVATEAVNEGVEGGWRSASVGARDSQNRMYTTMIKDGAVAYWSPYNNLVYSREGDVIGFKGEDKKLHFHTPSDGWAGMDLSNVGRIANTLEGTGTIPDFSTFKTPETKVKPINETKAARPAEANEFNQKTFDAVLNKINSLSFFDTADLKADPQSKERLSRAIIDKGYDENTEIIMSSRTYEDKSITHHVVEMTLDGVEYKGVGLDVKSALGQLIKEIGEREKVTPLSESDRQTINVIEYKLVFPENAKGLDTPVARAQLARKIFDQKYGADATISIGVADLNMGTGAGTGTKVTIQINGTSYEGVSPKKYDANGVKAFKNAISNIKKRAT